jgi:hypothetical protein
VDLVFIRSAGEELRSRSVFSHCPVYEVRPRKDRRGFDLISDALPFGQADSVFRI